MSMGEDNIDLREILSNAKTIAVVGFSLQVHKPSFYVTKYLQLHGYRVIPVNPNLAGQTSGLGGEPCYGSLQEAAAKCGSTIDIVDIFRRSADIPPVVDDALAIGAKVIWMQQGITNELAAMKARANGATVIMDKCIKVEHAMLGLD